MEVSCFCGNNTVEVIIILINRNNESINVFCPDTESSKAVTAAFILDYTFTERNNYYFLLSELKSYLIIV